MLTLFFVTTCLYFASANAQWSDDFSDGSFLIAPSWQGDTSSFIINATQQLQLNAIDPGTSRLSSNTMIPLFMGIEWRFNIQLAFAPSSSNYARVYLVSDQPELNGNGYFLQFGEALSNDAVELFRQDGSNSLSICRGPDGQISSACELGVRVTRDQVGVWSVYIDTTGGTNYQFVALGAEGRYVTGSWLGIQCNYTSANSSRFYFDDFSIGPMTNDTMIPVTVFPHDVLFSEIYFEPTADALLPPTEFVELYNHTGDTLDLQGWSLTDGASTGTFPSGVKIAPGEFLVVCDEDDRNLFQLTIHVVGINSFPGLNNDIGDRLRLLAPDGMVVDELIFSDATYHDSQKNDGGWTLERIDTSFYCINEDNWKASVHPSGGTPGRINAVAGHFSDNTSPWLERGWLEDSSHVRLVFSEPVDHALEVFSYLLLSDEQVPIVPVSVIAKGEDEFELLLSQPFAGKYMICTVKGNVTDCPNNPVDTVHDVWIGYPEYVEEGDVILNEILFDPADDGSDFFEILNRSRKVIDLKDFSIVETGFDRFPEEGLPKVITPEHCLLFPGKILAFSEDIPFLKQHYSWHDKFHLIESEDLPDFNTTSGGLVLYSQDGKVMDWMHYDESWHHPLLRITKGISLERLSPWMESSQESTWHSAAGSMGYATPGAFNSQVTDTGESTSEVSLVLPVLTPNNDGDNDVLTIRYHFSDPGRTVCCRIFSAAGGSTRFLINNQLVGNEGVFSWDGTDDQHRLVPPGKYVVSVETVAITGSVKRYASGCCLFY